ncbi:MAG: MmgE/PrpD family protein [Candidatus Lambdaproteobacteria bacterium]|nr:MmgE/PrpD family protein [Candidatus Lambdaproteobacteria bacterium]
MIPHEVRVWPAAEPLPRERQLAWKLAEYAASVTRIDAEVEVAVASRLLDDAGVALAALERRPVAVARAMALAHPRPGGATLIGLPADVTVHAEWAAWANGTAVRELDFHDAIPDGGHPGDNIPPLLAVAQQTGRSGADLARAVAAAYEVQIALAKGIDVGAYRIEQFAHLAPAMVAGLGTLLRLPAPVIHQALNQMVHLAMSTRQNLKGEVTSWKAFAPGYYGKTAIELTDRAMRGEAGPAPIYEGEISVIAGMLGGPEARYTVALPAPGEPPRAILETYTKPYSAVIYSQAFIDLAFELRRQVRLDEVEEIVVRTNRVVHNAAGSGSRDPRKMDPDASRETLDHSLPYILAVALEDGRWRHDESYTPERAHRPSTVALWRKIRTVEDPAWNGYLTDPRHADRRAGGRVEIRLRDGRVVAAEQGVAHAHPLGAHPWRFDDYAGKFRSLAEPVLGRSDADAYVGLVRRLATLGAADVRRLVPALPKGRVPTGGAEGRGIFDHLPPTA